MGTYTETVADSIKAKDVIGLSQELIRIPSVYHNEASAAKFISDRLRLWGFKPRLVPVDKFGPSVVCSVGPRNAPSIVFNGHMDTVEVMDGWIHDPFGAKIEKGMLYGLGALDMKCGIAGMMHAFRTIAGSDAARRTRFVFQAVTGEEDTGYGTWELVKSGAFRGTRAVIVGEGFGGLKSITVGRRGSSYFDIDVIGRSAHGATPEKGINAIADASALVNALESLVLRQSKDMVGDDFKPLRESHTVLKIQGGKDSLSVPEKCYIYLVNYPLPGSKNTMEADLKRLARRLKLKSKVRVKMRTGIHLYHPYRTPEGSALVIAASKALKRETGNSPTLIYGLSEADDNIIAHEFGVPTICFGPGESGSLAKYHEPEEAVSVSQIGPAARAYAYTALSLAEGLDR
jgi:acetylornithine deacetylase/succinyl-diaminopimelate desuccinylase-like protein